MKKIIACACICYMPIAAFAVKIVVPEMELGHWVTKVDASSMLEKALASVPKENRAMVKKMMEQKVQSTRTSGQCITKEKLANFDQQIKQAFGEQNNCKFKVIESNRKKFVATMNCPGSVVQIETNIISAKRNESTITSNVGGGGESILTSVSEWQSSECPASL